MKLLFITLLFASARTKKGLYDSRWHAPDGVLFAPQTFCCVAETRRLQTIEAFESFCGTIECQPPNANLYRFVGRINLWQETGAKVTRPLTAENLLLRGSRLKNTPFIYGAGGKRGSRCVGDGTYRDGVFYSQGCFIHGGVLFTGVFY